MIIIISIFVLLVFWSGAYAQREHAKKIEMDKKLYEKEEEEFLRKILKENLFK